MLKKIIATILAAQLVIQPAQAQTNQLPPMTKEQEHKFCKAIFGVDDVTAIMIAAVVAYGLLSILSTYGRILNKEAKEKEIEKLKADAKKRCTT
jgi:hypothetical protein